jgi:hypothetical protein
MIHKIACLTDPFARVAKAVLDDKRITWKAKGIFAYLMSKPDNWKGVIADVVNHGADGATAVRAAMTELESFGYARQERVREAGRMAGLVWHVTDDPNYFAKPPRSENLHVENPEAGKADSGNPAHSKKDQKKKELLTDEQWMEKQKLNPAWKGIDIDREFAKMAAWCEVKSKKPSRARFVNWLNRCEVPLVVTVSGGNKLPAGVVRGARPPQANGWNRDRFYSKIGQPPAAPQV